MQTATARTTTKTQLQRNTIIAIVSIPPTTTTKTTKTTYSGASASCTSRRSPPGTRTCTAPSMPTMVKSCTRATTTVASRVHARNARNRQTRPPRHHPPTTTTHPPPPPTHHHHRCTKWPQESMNASFAFAPKAQHPCTQSTTTATTTTKLYPPTTHLAEEVVELVRQAQQLALAVHHHGRVLLREPDTGKLRHGFDVRVVRLQQHLLRHGAVHQPRPEQRRQRQRQQLAAARCCG